MDSNVNAPATEGLVALARNACDAVRNLQSGLHEILSPPSAAGEIATPLAVQPPLDEVARLLREIREVAEATQEFVKAGLAAKL